LSNSLLTYQSILLVGKEKEPKMVHIPALSFSRLKHLILTVDWTNYGVDFGILDTMDDKKCNQIVPIVGSGSRVLRGSGSRSRAEH
jgi:hypothetical protein